MLQSIRNGWLVLTIFVITLVFQGQSVMCANSSLKKQNEKEIVEKACLLLDTDNSFELVTIFKQNANSAETANRFSQLIRVLYFEKKEISKMVLAGRIGIQFALSEADKQEGEEKEKLLSLAKEMSYNIAVNCWPGWGDEGIVVNSTDLVAGMDGARLNLKLAIQLKKDEDKIGNAHWAIGAQYLAIQKYKLAIESFEKAAEMFKLAKKNDFYWMAKGYISLALILAKDNSGLQLEKESFNELEKIGTDDSRYFIKQIKTARKIFEK